MNTEYLVATRMVFFVYTNLSGKSNLRTAGQSKLVPREDKHCPKDHIENYLKQA
jgi:hypothetical protein